MTLHQLRIFECVVKHLNITKASVTLHISQPSVSQQLKLLESEFGRKFLIRVNHGVELTCEGKEFFDAIRPLLNEADNLEKRFKNGTPAADTVPLIVGGSHNVSVNVLPKLLMEFKQRHPTIQFVLETNDSPTVEKRLVASELEIALLTNPSHRAEIVYEPYEEMELVAFCLPSNPIARKKLALKELVECPLVLRGGGRTDRMFTSLAQKVNVALRCELSSTVKAAVRMGMGVGILYRNAIASRVARGSLKLINVPELKNLGIKSFIAYDKRKPLTPMAREFFQMLLEKRNFTADLDGKTPRLVNGRTLPLH
jgi:DNA-binding transcriptional LysR family regulator